MRLSKTIEVEKGIILVKELTVGEVRQLITDFTSDQTFKGMTDFQILEKLPEIVKKSSVLQLPEGMEIDDLSLSEVTSIVQVFNALHEDFFDLLKPLIEKVSQMNIEQLSKRTAQSLLSEGTATSSSTDGPSSKAL